MKLQTLRFPERQRSLTLVVLLWTAVLATAGMAQDPAEQRAPDDRGNGSHQSADDVVARVDDVPIHRSQLEWEVKKAFRSQVNQGSNSQRETIREQALELLIRRQIVLKFLTANGLAATDSEIDREIQRIEKQLERLEKTLSDFLADRGSNAKVLRSDLQWQLSWQKALAKYMSDENVQKYFDQRKRHFDGSRIRVAHILRKVSAEGSRKEIQRAREKAIAELDDVRKRIAAKELTFAEAAKEYSDAPTRNDGGNIGWISRHDPMPESFSRPAFDLATGAVSPPVVTPFGVHLIQMLEHEPGDKSAEQVEDAVRADMRQYLFDWFVQRMRDDTNVVRP